MPLSGVRQVGLATFYVKRSLKMSNYPGVWSLLSIQFQPSELQEPEKVSEPVNRLFEKMSRERLGECS